MIRALLLAIPTVPIAAQQQWTTAHAVPRPNAEVHLCAHRADGRIVALTARPQQGTTFETWEWDGARWHQRHPVQGLPWCQGPALAYDADRRRIVAFGGVDGNNTYLDTTWEWDGVTWTQRQPAVSPPARYVAGMVYDSRRRRCVLYGGSDQGGRLGDLWEWDGTTWQPRTVPGSAPPATSPMMAFDDARGVTVLCPHDQLAPTLEVFEYDGTQWTHPAPAVRPPGLGGAKVAWDPHRARTVFYGGYSGFGSTGVRSTDFLAWDGAQWQRTTPAVPLPFRTGTGFAYDERARRFVLHGGGEFADTWTWDPQTTTWARMPQVAPHDVRLAVSDWNGSWFVKSTRDAFVWNRADQTFTHLTPPVSPPVSSLFGMAFDLVRQEVVLLAGTANGVQTWLWSVSLQQWRLAPGPAPTAAAYSTLAYDASQDRTIYCGGIENWLQAPQFATDTWEWNGSNWTRRTPSQSPPPRAHAAMAYDVATGRLVLFGGQGAGSVLLDDTWTWDGTTWSPIATTAPPPARAMHAMVTRSGGVQVIGGGDVNGPALADSWLLQGTQWINLSTTGLPALGQIVAAGDPLADEIAVFGGANPMNWPTSGVWLFAEVPALVTPFGAGCGAAGATALDASARPALGTTISLDAAGLGAGQPALFALGLDARALELPGSCRSRVDAAVTIFAPTDANGAARLPIAVPASPGFLGTLVYAEAAALDPATAFALTPALRLRIGR